MSPESVWSAWLDAVEAAARRTEREALDGAPTGPAPLPLPDVPWPASLPSLEDRRREVLTALAVATATAERCRDEIAAELARVATVGVRPPRSGYTDGAALDVLG